MKDGKDSVAQRAERFLRKRKELVALVLALLGLIAAYYVLINPDKPVQDGPLLSYYVGAAPWPLDSDGYHDVCIHVNNAGSEDALVEQFEVRFTSSDRKYTYLSGLENLTRVNGDSNDRFVPAHDFALFFGSYYIQGHEERFLNFQLILRPLVGEVVEARGASNDLTECLVV